MGEDEARRAGARQLPLALKPLPPRRRRPLAPRHVGAANAEACRWLDAFPDWPRPGLLLLGPEGAGKTHLARHWADRAGATLLPAAALSTVDPLDLAEEPVAVDGIDALPPEGEAALFHLLNALAATGQPVLATARRLDRAAFRTADLASRIGLLATVRIDPPDDELLAAVLASAFAERQLSVDRRVVDYLLPRMERSLAAATRLAARLDRAALALKRPVTRPLAAALLSGPAAEGACPELSSPPETP